MTKSFVECLINYYTQSLCLLLSAERVRLLGVGVQDPKSFAPHVHARRPEYPHVSALKSAGAASISGVLKPPSHSYISIRFINRFRCQITATIRLELKSPHHRTQMITCKSLKTGFFWHLRKQLGGVSSPLRWFFRVPLLKDLKAQPDLATYLGLSYNFNSALTSQNRLGFWSFQ